MQQADVPLLVLLQFTPVETGLVAGLAQQEVQEHAVRGIPVQRGVGGAGHPLGGLVPPHQQFACHLGRPHGGMGEHGVHGLRQRMVDGIEPALPQDAPAVQSLRQPLQHRTGQRIALHDLPESRRTTAVLLLITMVEAPDAVPGQVQDTAFQNAESQAQQDVRSMSCNGLQILRIEAFCMPCSLNFTAQAWHAGQQVVDPFRAHGGRVEAGAAPPPVQRSAPAVPGRVRLLSVGRGHPHHRPHTRYGQQLLQGQPLPALDSRPVGQHTHPQFQLSHARGVAARPYRWRSSALPRRRC